MTPPLRAAERWAAGLYLVVVVTGLFSLMWVPSQVPLGLGEAAPALLARVREHEVLLRWGVVAFVVKQLAFALLPLALWQRLQQAGPRAAAAMVMLVALSVPVALVALTGRLQVLWLAGPDAPVLPPDAVQALVTAAQATWRQGLWLAQWFWGLWLAPLGWLAWRARLLPRALAACLMAGCVGYLALVLAPFLGTAPAPAWVTLPAAVGEIGACLWLVGRAWMPARSRAG